MRLINTWFFSQRCSIPFSYLIIAYSLKIKQIKKINLLNLELIKWKILFYYKNEKFNCVLIFLCMRLGGNADSNYMRYKYSGILLSFGKLKWFKNTAPRKLFIFMVFPMSRCHWVCYITSCMSSNLIVFFSQYFSVPNFKVHDSFCAAR